MSQCSPEECANAHKHNWSVGKNSDGVPCITFTPCGVTSTHPADISHVYCARCHRFIGEVYHQECVRDNKPVDDATR
jgi:hypothetical protein